MEYEIISNFYTVGNARYRFYIYGTMLNGEHINLKVKCKRIVYDDETLCNKDNVIRHIVERFKNINDMFIISSIRRIISLFLNKYCQLASQERRLEILDDVELTVKRDKAFTNAR